VGNISRFVLVLVKQCLRARATVLPTSALWYVMSMILGDFFLFPKSKKQSHSRDPRAEMERIRSVLNTEVKFSAYRCGLGANQAREDYYLDLSELYTAAEHERRKCAALRKFYSYARGSATERHREQLITEFDHHWEDRRRCGAVSLTGHVCKYPEHKTPLDIAAECADVREEAGEVREHCSDYVSVGACNCGKTRKNRVDPFTFEEANQSFFHARCCDQYATIKLPETKEGWNLLLFGSASLYEERVGISQDGFKMRYKSLHPFEIELQPPTPTPAPVAKQEEFPPLHQPKKNTVVSRADPPKRIQSRDSRSRRRVVGGYIGYEYECSMGHRFIEPVRTILENSPNASAKKARGDGDPLDIDALRASMPLFSTCMSASKHPPGGSQPMSRLQRIFLCTPRGVDLRITPTVHITGNFDGVAKKLTFSINAHVVIPEESFVCLRLSYIYQYQDKPIVQQTPSGPYQGSFSLIV